MQKDNQVINWRIAGIADVVLRDWTSGADDEVDDENAVERFHDSGYLLSKTMFCSRKFHSDLAGPVVADKWTAFLPK